MSTTNSSLQKDKRTILGSVQDDPNQIFLPDESHWARQYYKNGVANNWVPQEVSMTEDYKQWIDPSFLSAAERKLILRNLGFFSTAESLTANNLVVIFPHIINFECQQYLIRQAFEETIHSETFIYCCESLRLGQGEKSEIYNMRFDIPSIKEKDDFVIELTKSISNSNFRINNDSDIQPFLRDLIGYYVIMEGIFFYAGFAMILALKRSKRKGNDGKEQNIMVGIGQQFEFIMRDESLHLAFGCGLINTITGAKPAEFGKGEYPQVWTEDFKNEIIGLIKKAVELEKKYALEACPEGVVGINAQQFCEYVEYIANRRLERIGLPKVYFDKTTKIEVRNPFPWMSQSVDLNKEKNFFETRLTEYQTGSLKWDEEEEK